MHNNSAENYVVRVAFEATLIARGEWTIETKLLLLYNNERNFIQKV